MGTSCTNIRATTEEQIAAIEIELHHYRAAAVPKFRCLISDLSREEYAFLYGREAADAAFPPKEKQPE